MKVGMSVYSEFSFLTSGPDVGVTLPDPFSATPALSSPLISGVGARSFDFNPPPVADELIAGYTESMKYLTTLDDHDGRAVEVYERAQTPIHWYLLWRLASGVIATHLREEDGKDRAAVVAPNISISEDGPTPLVLPFSPVRSGVSAVPGYAEFAQFGDSSWGVSIVRPAFLKQGSMVVYPGADWVSVRIGASGGMEVRVSTNVGNSQEAQDLASSVATSLSYL